MAHQRVRGTVFGSKPQDKFILHRRNAQPSDRWLVKWGTNVYSFQNLPTARAFVGGGGGLTRRYKNSNWKRNV